MSSTHIEGGKDVVSAGDDVLKYSLILEVSDDGGCTGCGSVKILLKLIVVWSV